MDLKNISQQQLADIIVAANAISGIINASAISQTEGRLMKPKVTKRSDGRYMRKMLDENGKYKYFTVIQKKKF